MSATESIYQTNKVGEDENTSQTSKGLVFQSIGLKMIAELKLLA